MSKDASVWESVELTYDSMKKKMDSQSMKKLIRLYFPKTVRRVVIEESRYKGNMTITESFIDLLFTLCPGIKAVSLINCDLKKVLFLSVAVSI